MSHSKRSLQPATLLLSGAHLINDMYCGFLAPVLPLLMAKFDLSLTLAAALASILSIMTSLIQPVQGYISDKMNRAWFVTFGPMVTATFMSLIGLAPNYTILIVFLVLSGIGTSSFHPQAAALVSQTSGAKKGLSMSVFVTGGTIGVAIGPLLILGVIKLWSFNHSYITIIPGLILSGFLFRYIFKLKPVERTQSSGDLATSKIDKNTIFFITLLALIAISRATTASMFNNLTPIFLTQLGFPTETAAISVSLLLTLGAFGSIAGGALSDRIGYKATMLISHLLSTPLALGFMYFEGILKFIFLGTMAFILFLALPVTIVLAQELVPHRSGTVASLMMGFCWGIGGLLLTPLGSLGDAIGLDKVFWGVSFVPLLGTIFLIPILRAREPEAIVSVSSV